jgi:hypothetical protein
MRQLVAFYKEYEEKDHYSSRSTTDLDLMEVITETEAPKYLKDLTFEEKRKHCHNNGER